MSGAAAAAMVGGQAFGSVINAWMTYKGMKMSERAHGKSIASQERIFERQFGEEKRAARVGERMQKENLALRKKQDAFARRQTFVNNYLTMLNSSPQAKAQLLSAARGRR